MADLPVMLKVRGQRCVIVGGGAVARRRAQALLDAGAEVTVIAPNIVPPLMDLARRTPRGLRIERREYEPGDLDDARLVVIATDDAALNDRIAADAAIAGGGGTLVNRADEPEAGDVTIPAHAHHGPITLAVHTSGISAAAAATIRRQLSEALDPDWPRLLKAVTGYRMQLQDTVPDPIRRRERLRRLTDEQAMRILKSQGVEALRRYCESMVGGEA